MDSKKIGAGILGAGMLIMGGVDASVLDEQPIERTETIAEERVEARQIENRVETTFPWKDQEGLKVVVDLGEPTIGERIADKRKQEVVTETVDFGDGGFKVDILLNERPDTNRFCYQIEGAENYDFFYQPELTPDEIEQGAIRPPEIVGSYAVYHRTLANHVEGQENYKTGKVMHIPRPQVWSLADEENKEWADLSYHNGELCVTVDQGFLDGAEYPVRVDPTFGYTSVGVNTLSRDGYVYASLHTSPSDVGTLDSISWNGRYTTTGTKAVKAGIYVHNTLAFVGSTDEITGGTTITWNTHNFTGPLAISASTEYLISLFVGDGNASLLRYDNGATDQGHDHDIAYGTWPDPLVAVHSTRLYSIYATYTASGGGATSTPDSIIMFE